MMLDNIAFFSGNDSNLVQSPVNNEVQQLTEQTPFQVPRDLTMSQQNSQGKSVGPLSSDKAQNQVIRTSIVVNNKSRNDTGDIYLNTSSGNLLGVNSN